MPKYLKWSWWNERVIEVPEHYFDWMAPRWYLVVVIVAYLLGFVAMPLYCLTR